MRFDVDEIDLRAIKKIERELSLLLTEIVDRNSDISIYKSGFLAITLAWYDALESDVLYLFTSCFLLILVGLGLFYRSLSLSLATFLLSLLAMICALGFTGHIGQAIQAPTAIGLLMILMLGLADCIHIVSSARRFLGDGHSKVEAIAMSVEFNSKAVILTSLTTAIGFLTFLFSDAQGTRVMGVSPLG